MTEEAPLKPYEALLDDIKTVEYYETLYYVFNGLQGKESPMQKLNVLQARINFMYQYLELFFQGDETNNNPLAFPEKDYSTKVNFRNTLFSQTLALNKEEKEIIQMGIFLADDYHEQKNEVLEAVYQSFECNTACSIQQLKSSFHLKQLKYMKMGDVN